MTIEIETNFNEVIKELYNGSVQTIKNVIPIEPQFEAPKIRTTPVHVEYGVFIGYSGTFKCDLLVQATPFVFSGLGMSLYGMELPEEMVDSFSGELGNMLAGGLSTHLANRGINTDITHPTIMNGHTNLTGFKRVLEVQIQFEQIGNMNMLILLNQ